MRECGHLNPDAGKQHQLCVALVPIFNHLPEEDMEEIAKATRTAKFGKGEEIYGAGDVSAHLYIVHSGRVKIFRLAESGKEQLIRVLKPGDFMGELALFSGSPFDHYAVAMEPTELCIMRRSDLEAFLKKHPKIALKIMEEFSRRLEATEKLVSSLTSEDAEQRIADYLVAQSDEQESSSILLPMPKKDIASLLGTTPETVSRKLAEFHDRGWLRQTGQRKMEILDKEALRGL